MLRYAALLALLSTTALADVPAPTSVVIVACRVSDHTGEAGRHDPSLAAKNWRDLELVIKDGEYQCKREVLQLEDGAVWGSHAPEELIPLHPNFGNPAQCAKVGVMQAAEWNESHKGWAVVAVGCPTKIVNEQGEIVGWHMPSCPSFLPGTDNRMKCNFDESTI
jgi:hypothetical protein